MNENELRRLAKKVVRLVQGTMGLESQAITDPEVLSEIEAVAVTEIQAKLREDELQQSPTS